MVLFLFPHHQFFIGKSVKILVQKDLKPNQKLETQQKKPDTNFVHASFPYEVTHSC